MNVSTIMPPITAVPITCRAIEPAPDAVQSGTQPRMNANDVIRRGRKRSLAASSAASTRGLPLSYSILRKRDDQDRVLRRESDQHHQPDLRIHIVLDLDAGKPADTAPSATAAARAAAKAPKTAIGVLNRTLNGRVQLS